MAHIVLMDPRFTFNAIDLSDHVTSLELTVGTNQVEDIAGGDTVETFLAALRKFGGTVEGYQDHAASECEPNSLGYCACPLELADPDVAELVCSDLHDGRPDVVRQAECVTKTSGDRA